MVATTVLDIQACDLFEIILFQETIVVHNVTRHGSFIKIDISGSSPFMGTNEFI